MSERGGRTPPRALVYVVEDDEDVARVVLRALGEFDFATDWFRDGQSLLRRLRTERPELCVVDLGLPDMDGIELVRQIGSQYGCGILILTGRTDIIDRVMGLELGGDDYVLKPFEPRELVARVRSILRRRGKGPPAGPNRRRFAHFAGWTLDCAANTLRASDGAEYLLGTAESQVLRALVERPNQILSREQLQDQRERTPSDRTIDVRISRLRRRLEQDTLRPTIIKTVYGAGYLFTAPVEWT